MRWREQLSRVRSRLRGPASSAAASGLAELAKNWGMLARADPLWAILADPSKKGGRWNLDEFLATGEHEIETALGRLDGLSIRPGRGRALDFGCGVGRLTRALALHFERVDGVDVSEEMLEQARRLHAAVPRCRFTRVTSTRLPFAGGTMDLVYSRLVLQHMETPLAVAYVREFARLIKPGGVAVFQAPSRYLPGQSAKAVTPVIVEGGTALVEMNAHPRERVEEAVLHAGGRVVEVRLDDCAGEAFESLSYTVTR